MTNEIDRVLLNIEANNKLQIANHRHDDSLRLVLFNQTIIKYKGDIKETFD